MGVRGLLRMCLEGADACSDTYDLVEEARHQNGLELIVDFNSFKHHILLTFWKGLSQLRGNDYLYNLGGEYATLHNYVTKLVNDLKSLDIHLVFYIDGEKGSSIEGLKRKLGTWVRRHRIYIERMSQILYVLQHKTDISKLSWETKINPVVLDEQLMATLRSCDCEIHQSPAGEADLLIIRALRDRPKAFAILSRDSDFCVFKESRLIPDELFDITNDLQLGEPRELPEKPRRLIVKLKDHEHLVEMSIVTGNDYTGPYMRKYIEKIEIKGGLWIRNFTDWIQTFRKVQEHPYLADCIEHDPGFRQAVIHSRNFYNLIGEPDKCPQKGDFSQVIEQKIRSGFGQYPSNIMSMHNNCYWCRILLEDNSNEAPRAEFSLLPLRAYLYRIVLSKDEQLVDEYCRRPFDDLPIDQVANDDGRVPAFDKIQPDDLIVNLQTFHFIWSHQETGLNMLKSIRRISFFYILRYFLLLNWGKNLKVKEDEFLALVAMVMGSWDEKKYQAIVIRPTVRCVTIGNWMQDVYRHGYNMFGSVLHIRHKFPLPSELFSGSVWTAMYMTCQEDTFQDAFRRVSPEVLDQIKKEKSTVNRENNGVSSEVLDQIEKEKSTADRENNGVSSEVLDQTEKEKSTADRENNGVSSEVLDQTEKEKSTADRENNGVSSEVLNMIKEEKNTVIQENHDMIRDMMFSRRP